MANPLNAARPGSRNRQLLSRGFSLARQVSADRRQLQRLSDAARWRRRAADPDQPGIEPGDEGRDGGLAARVGSKVSEVDHARPFSGRALSQFLPEGH
jgi:hypothetical protein